MRQPGSNTVVLFFDGGAGDCPAALQEALRVVRSGARGGDIDSRLDKEGACQAHVVGHAAGGYEALKFAVTHPERTRSLILSETSTELRVSRAKLRDLAVPVLVLAGGSDSRCPLPAARKLAACFSKGRVAEIVEAVHSPFAETPEEWCEVVLQFLRSVTRPRGAAQ